MSNTDITVGLNVQMGGLQAAEQFLTQWLARLQQQANITINASASGATSGGGPGGAGGRRSSAPGAAGQANMPSPHPGNGGGGGGGVPPPSPRVPPPAPPPPGAGGSLKSFAPGLYGLMHGQPGVYARAALEGSAIAVGNAAGDWFRQSTQETLSGRPDILMQAQSKGALVGGLLGAAGGAVFGTMGAYIGAGIGGNLGGMMGEWLAKDKARDTRLGSALIPSAAMSANRAGDWGSVGYQPHPYDILPPSAALGDSLTFRNPALGRSKDLAAKMVKRSEAIGRAFWADPNKSSLDDEWMQYYATPQQMAETYSTIYDAFVNAGIDPETRTSERSIESHLSPESRRAIGVGYRTMQMGQQTTRDEKAYRRAFGGAGQIEEMQGIAMMVAGLAQPRQITAGTEQTLVNFMNDNIAYRYGTAGEAAAKAKIAPIINTMQSFGGAWRTNPYTGGSMNPGNFLDIMMKHGPAATAVYAEAWAPFGNAPAVDQRTLMNFSGRAQGINYARERASLGVRGVGADLYSMDKDLVSAISDSGIPGADTSVIMLKTRQALRASMFRKEREEDIMNYGLPAAQLEGRRTRSQYLPFSPGYGMKQALEGITMRSGYMKTLRSRYMQHMKDGDLSEEDQLQAVQQYEGLSNQTAADLSVLAEGGENRTLALSSGAPSFRSRMDSAQLASLAVARSGAPNIGYGSIGGRHLKSQNDFFRGVLGDMEGLPILSSQRGGDPSNIAMALNRNTAALDRHTQALETRMTGGGSLYQSGTRPGEAWGKQNARIQAGDFDPVSKWSDREAN